MAELTPFQRFYHHGSPTYAPDAATAAAIGDWSAASAYAPRAGNPPPPVMSAHAAGEAQALHAAFPGAAGDWPLQRGGLDAATWAQLTGGADGGARHGAGGAFGGDAFGAHVAPQATQWQHVLGGDAADDPLMVHLIGSPKAESPQGGGMMESAWWGPRDARPRSTSPALLHHQPAGWSARDAEPAAHGDLGVAAGGLSRPQAQHPQLPQHLHPLQQQPHYQADVHGPSGGMQGDYAHIAGHMSSQHLLPHSGAPQPLATSPAQMGAPQPLAASPAQMGAPSPVRKRSGPRNVPGREHGGGGGYEITRLPRNRSDREVQLQQMLACINDGATGSNTSTGFNDMRPIGGGQAFPTVPEDGDPFANFAPIGRGPHPWASYSGPASHLERWHTFDAGGHPLRASVESLDPALDAMRAHAHAHTVHGSAVYTHTAGGGGGVSGSERTVRGGTALRELGGHAKAANPLKPVVIRAGRRTNVPSGSLDGSHKRKTLTDMVRAADQTAAPGFALHDGSHLGSSKRTRTSHGCFSTSHGDTSVAGGASAHTGLTAGMHLSRLSDPSDSVHMRRRNTARGDVQGEGKEERSLEEWLALIAKEEAAGDGAAEAALLQEFLDWERLSSTAPNGKWRGANSRKWGKVGIEMRLTGNVPCTEGPVTELGQMICKFVDIVEDRPAVRVDGISDGPSTSASNDGAERGAASAENASQASGNARDGALAPHASSSGGVEFAGEVSPSSAVMPPRAAKALLGGPAETAVPTAEGGAPYVWKLMRIADKGAGFRTVLKEKVWLGTYHTPINAAVHHDFYKVVLAVEGCIFTCMNIPTCTQPLGKKKTHKLKLNFGLDELPALMYKAVKFSKLWNRHKQDAERYVFRNHSAEAVRSMLEALIAAHCGELRQHIAKNEAEGTAATVERRSSRRRNAVSTRSGAGADSGED